MYTKADILRQLEDMGAPRGSAVIMHTALRRVGKIDGGAEALLDGMIEYFTEGGGLFCVPTHTWANLGTDKITLDMSRRESNLGAFPLVALGDGRGVRSENPTHSMVVFGDKGRALDLIKGDTTLSTPTARESAYGGIYDADGYVLLVGVGQDKNTYLHFVDELLGTAGRMSRVADRTTVKRLTGEVIEREIYMYDESRGDISLLFPKYEAAFRYHGCIKDGFIGAAPTQLCSARGMAEVVARIVSRAGCDPLRDVDVIPEQWYK